MSPLSHQLLPWTSPDCEFCNTAMAASLIISWSFQSRPSLCPLFNWTLYGILCIQIYMYSCNFPNDRLSLKFLVYFVFLLETVQTALTGADVYY
ncbi:hypothetical protein EI94DRAFT_1117393 [Lactarius quietus]|nr:hypothetical protein EI94DRAFT_1117393 [Lactarius quietus]